MSVSIQNLQFVQQLKLLPFVYRILLYGSRARSDNQTRSDIDIAIDCPDANDQEWQQVLDIIENADSLLKIDCVRFDELSDSSPLKNNIMEGAELIFERE